MNYVGNEPAPGGLVLVGDTNPVGAIVWGHKVPDGSYLGLNGQVVSKVTYADLWTYAQGFLTADQVANPGLYKSIDANNFALPKLDGLFIRSTGTLDADRAAAALGALQGDQFQSHVHALPPVNLFVGGSTGDGGSPVRIVGGDTDVPKLHASGGATLRTGKESRPANVALVPSVKALKTVLMTAAAMPTIPPQDFVLLDSKVAAASPTLDFTAGISDAFSVYQVEIINLQPATDDASLGMRVSLDGGATFFAGGADYSETFNLVQNSVNNPTSHNNDRLAVSTGAANGALFGVNGTVKIYRSQAGTRAGFTVQVAHFRTGTSMENWLNVGMFNTVTGPLNALRFFFSAGNAATGRLKLYGLR